MTRFMRPRPRARRPLSRSRSAIRLSISASLSRFGARPEAVSRPGLGRLPVLAQLVEPDHLAVEERHRSDGYRAELLLDLGQVALLDLAQVPEVALRVGREDPVRNDQVAGVAEQMEVGE